MKRLIYPVLFGLGLAGCSQSQPAENLAVATETSAAQLVTSGEAAYSPAAAAVATPQPAPALPAPQPDHHIIYQGEMDLAVDDFEQTSGNIYRLLEQYHAYLGTAHETRANGQHRQEMTIKVPPTRFLPFVVAISKLGRIENKDVSSADVTADMLQAATSLEAKQATEAKYQQFLAQATSPAEVRRLEEQSRQLHLDLAADQARLQQFGARSTWASLTLRYFQALPEAEPKVTVPVFAPRFLDAFYRGWAVVLGVLVAFTNLWPLLLLGTAGAWGWWRWCQRHPAEV